METRMKIRNSLTFEFSHFRAVARNTLNGGHAGTLFGDNLAVFGGEDRRRQVLRDVYVLVRAQSGPSN